MPVLPAHQFCRNLAPETCQHFRNACSPQCCACYPAGDPCQSTRSNPGHPGCPHSAAPSLGPCATCPSLHAVGFTAPFSPLSPPSSPACPTGLEKDQRILHWAMHPPKIPSQRSIPPTSSLRAQPGAGSEPPSCCACSHLSSKYPIRNKTANIRPDATTALQNHLSGSPAVGPGVTASLSHPGCPCLPRVIKPINGSHGP